MSDKVLPCKHCGLPLAQPADSDWRTTEHLTKKQCIAALAKRLEEAERECARLMHMIEEHYVAKPFVNTLEKMLEDVREECAHHQAWVAVVTAENEALRKHEVRWDKLRRCMSRRPGRHPNHIEWVFDAIAEHSTFDSAIDAYLSGQVHAAIAAEKPRNS